MTSKSFEIFSGTGGVGKTTLAASRALCLADSGKNVLLITIDPAKRLKDLLGISDIDAGEIKKVEFIHEQNSISLDVELMNPERTFQRIAAQTNKKDILDNRILKVLTKPYGGLNEILSVVELNLQKDHYDVIVLDTPPGSHFLDFLDSIERIKVFFDKSFMEIFQYLGKKIDTNSKMNFGKRMVTMVVSTGVKKLLGYLNKVTGEKFVDDFVEAVLDIYSTKDAFLKALDLQKTLKDHAQSNWYLVTSVEQNKLREALEIQKSARDIFSDKSTIILNKSLKAELKSWHPTPNTAEEVLKKSLLERETQLESKLQNNFKNVLSFPEILSSDTKDHLEELLKTWNMVRA